MQRGRLAAWQLERDKLKGDIAAHRLIPVAHVHIAGLIIASGTCVASWRSWLARQAVQQTLQPPQARRVLPLLVRTAVSSVS